MTVSDAGSTLKTPEAENVALTRGNAIWVNRQDTTKPFYIYGQVVTPDSSATLPAIVEGAYTMMGNTALEPVAINSITFNGTPKAGDKIVWGSAENATGTTEVEYKDGAWGFYESKVEEVEVNGKKRKVISTEWTTKGLPKVPAGQGFWYVSQPAAAQ